MKLSVYTVSLPEYDIAESVQVVKEMGYDAIEWRVEDTGTVNPMLAKMKQAPAEQQYAFRYWLDNRSTLNLKDIKNECLKAKELCDRAGLEIVNLAPSRIEGEDLENTIAAAAAIGCKTIRGPMTGYDMNKPYWEQFEDYRTYLRKSEPLLKKYGVKMLIETHHGMMICSASSAMRTLEGFDPAYYGVIYDPGNMVYEGYECYDAAVQMLGKYLAHVHIKNAALTPGGEDAFGAVKYNQSWMPLKKGSANLGALIKALVKAGYDGTLSVEDFSNEKPTREKLSENIAYLKQLIEAAKA